MIILIFDTETSGLYPEWNKMLQLSWQLVDTRKHWKILSKQNFYFRHPGKDRVSKRAIRVNGLTKERLAQLGTVPRSKALKLFAKDLSQADLCVAHNFNFDASFINFEDIKNIIKWPKTFCTMTETTDLCKIPFQGIRPSYANDGQKYKWPRLSELANHLKINTKTIRLHDSAGDVELTKRCFRSLMKRIFK